MLAKHIIKTAESLVDFSAVFRIQNDESENDVIYEYAGVEMVVIASLYN